MIVHRLTAQCTVIVELSPIIIIVHRLTAQCTVIVELSPIIIISASRVIRHDIQGIDMFNEHWCVSLLIVSKSFPI